MGWTDWWKSDPLASLDPDVRKYLDAGTAERRARREQQQAAEAKSYVEQLAEQQAAQSQPTQPDTPGAVNEHGVPLPTHFPDGRYAHLWKTYVPQHQHEQEHKSSTEDINDVVDAFKQQSSRVKSAAIESCADEEFELYECFAKGGFGARMTLCRPANRRFLRCVETQAKLLRALGFSSMVQRSAPELERIQMHADLLYHRMLDHEAAVALAKEQGTEPPPMPDVADAFWRDEAQQARSPGAAAATRQAMSLDRLPPHVQAEIIQREFPGLTGLELEIAKREFSNRLALNHDVLVSLEKHELADRAARAARREQGTATLGDRIRAAVPGGGSGDAREREQRIARLEAMAEAGHDADAARGDGR